MIKKILSIFKIAKGWKIKVILILSILTAIFGWGEYKQRQGFNAGQYKAHLEAARQYGKIVNRLSNEIIKLERKFKVKEKEHREAIEKLSNEYEYDSSRPVSPFLRNYYEFLRTH